ncbi:MAG: energy-coupling factor ABC transporter ATP-binding protein [Phycisphaerae bacterium]|nr:energy-coupling factor ABC transporter ATP-binding protein [Phycisphaerae bacterium]
MSGSVLIDQYSYTYSDSSMGLDDVSLNITPGEKVALVGANGSGKSTLLLAMGGFIKGTGAITIDGVESNSKNLKRIRSLIGSVLQNPDEQLFMPTLFEDVAFGPQNMGLSFDEVHSITHQAIDRAGLNGMENKAPHHMSAGQKRAAAIATILSMSPKIITMDEPDTSLDPASRKKLVILLGSLSQTLIIATCNMDFAARVSSRCIVIGKGKVVADGPPQKILTDENLMEQNGLETARFD